MWGHAQNASIIVQDDRQSDLHRNNEHKNVNGEINI